MKVGYFNHFGVQQVQKAAGLYNKQHEDQIELQPLYQDQVRDALLDHQIDLAITDPRNNNFSIFQVIPLKKVSLVVMLQAGNYLAGQQTIEKADLASTPVIIAAKLEEEKGEVDYQENILKNPSPLIAVENYSEAALMAASGSGYFLMNELTAPYMRNDQLQKMFLLDNGQQVKEDYAAVYKNKTAAISEYINLLNNELK